MEIEESTAPAAGGAAAEETVEAVPLYEHAEQLIPLLTPIAENVQCLNEDRFIELRQIFARIASKLEKNNLSGFRTSKTQEKKQRKLQHKARELQKKHADQQYINSVKLRSQRIQALQALVEPTGQGEIDQTGKLLNGNTLPLLTDGNKNQTDDSKDTTITPSDTTPTPLTAPTAITPSTSTIVNITQSSVTKPYLNKPNKRVNKQMFQQEGIHINTERVEELKKQKIEHQSESVSVEDETMETKLNNDDDFGPELNQPRSCYCCKARFYRLHKFYDQFCGRCAILNWEKRNQMADLNGKIFLLTGSRVKIGYECGLRLLRCGATVIATSRFPHDTARRYGEEKDFDTWKSRLHIYGLDLRDLKSVIKLCELLTQRYDKLDGIINNAAQTVRRPKLYYRHLMEIECTPIPQLPDAYRDVIKGDVYHVANGVEQRRLQTSDNGMKVEQMNDEESSLVPDTSIDTTNSQFSVFSPAQDINTALTTSNRSALLSQISVHKEDDSANVSHFPEGKYDVTGQQLDLRPVNSWLLMLEHIEPSELVEVFAINALSPFILNSRLKSLLLRGSGDRDKWIINVSAMEGKFYRHKSPCHPHTNMAKAALNMLTRTSAQDYARDRIYMNSVDTGWINDENPYEQAQRIAQTNFQTPIDEIDAMARILDPILSGVNTGINAFGKFLKDFHETEW